MARTNKEVWKPIPGYENRYMVSNRGKVVSIMNTHGKKCWKIRKLNKTIDGYLRVSLYGGEAKYSKRVRVHRLVAQSFLPNPEHLPVVDHINTQRTDNYVENLRWVTRKDNVNNPLTAQKVKTRWKRFKHPSSHLVEGPDGTVYDSIKSAAKSAGKTREMFRLHLLKGDAWGYKLL